MILLEHLLDGLDVRVVGIAVQRLAAGEQLDVPPLDLPSIHFVQAGRGSLRAGTAASLALTRHVVAIVPAGSAISVQAEAAPGDSLLIACGRIEATFRSAAGLFDRLPDPLCDDLACESGLCVPLGTMVAELEKPRPGSRALADALLQQCLVLLLRRYCEGGECRLPWLSALENPRLGNALTAMLKEPERSWTIDQLADRAGMSRSSFAAQFTEAFEMPPIEFLGRLRLRRAAELLRSTDLPVKTIAGRVGYASRSAFSRAFRSWSGTGPDSFREARRSPASASQLARGETGSRG